MKEIDKKKFDEVVKKARVKFGLTYFGHSNHMTLAGTWNDSRIDDPAKLTDEQLVLLWQLVNSVQMMLVKEQARRDLLPEEIAKMYREGEKEK